MSDSSLGGKKNYLNTNFTILIMMVVGLPLAYQVPLSNIPTATVRIAFITFSFWVVYQAARPFASRLIKKLLSNRLFYLLCTVIGVILSLMIPPLAQVACIHDIQMLTRLPVEYFPHAQNFLSAVYIVWFWAIFFILLVAPLAFLLIGTGVFDKMIYQEEKKKRSFSEYVGNLFTGPYPRTYVLLSLIGLGCTLSAIQDFMHYLPSAYNPMRSIVSSMDLTWNVSCDHSLMYPGIQIHSKAGQNLFVIDDGSKFIVKTDCKYINPIT